MQPQALCAAVLLAGLCAETCGEPSRWQARVTREDARDGDVTPQTAASNHTNNWAVLVCTSRFWFNYRHMANTLSFYHTVKRLGAQPVVYLHCHSSASLKPGTKQLLLTLCALQGFLIATSF